jgi:hypothetical protein
MAIVKTTTTIEVTILVTACDTCGKFELPPDPAAYDASFERPYLSPDWLSLGHPGSPEVRYFDTIDCAQQGFSARVAAKRGG